MQGRIIVQHERELMQLRIAKALGLDRLHGRQEVVAVVSRTAMSLPHEAQLLGERKPSGILDVATVDYIGERADPLPGFVFKPDRAHDFAIDIGGLLAAAQIVHGNAAQFRRDPERNAATGATAVEAEHKAGFFRSSAMVKRIHAQRAMLADQPRGHLLDKGEAGPPHQRPIAEHPQVVFGRFRSGQAFG
jgi:hypothetical protein